MDQPADDASISRDLKRWGSQWKVVPGRRARSMRRKFTHLRDYYNATMIDLSSGRNGLGTIHEEIDLVQEVTEGVSPDPQESVPLESQTMSPPIDDNAPPEDGTIRPLQEDNELLEIRSFSPEEGERLVERSSRTPPDDEA
jgi:hypothetical protein